MKLHELMKKSVMYIAIGPSGSGKSTLFRKLQDKDPSLRAFSLDMLRHEWYDPTNYAAAWKASTEDKDFANKANERFMEMVEEGDNLFIDNTNLTPKRRRFYIEQARKRGYHVVGIVFNVDLDTLIARQKTRGDKNVPEQAIRQQLRSMVGPVIGEFDEVMSAEDV